MYKKIYYFTLLFTLNLLAQDKEFVINKKFDDAVALLQKYENKLSKEEIDPEKSADKFVYKLVLNNEVYNDSKDDDHYLNLVKSKPKTVKVTASIWHITLTKKNKVSTNVKIELDDIEVGDKYDFVDLDKSNSSGKLEEEIRDYFKSNTTIDELSASEKKGTVKEETLSEAKMVPDETVPDDKKVEKKETKAKAKEKPKKSAEKKAAEPTEIKKVDPKKAATSPKSKTIAENDIHLDMSFLLNKNKQISLPNEVIDLSTKFDVLEKEHPSTLCYGGKYYTWKYQKDFVFTYTELKNNTDIYSLQYYGSEKVKGLPYGVVFNKSTLNELKKQFAVNKPKVAIENEISSDNTGVRVTVMSFKVKSRSVKLYFNNSNILNGISESMINK